MIIMRCTCKKKAVSLCLEFLLILFGRINYNRLLHFYLGVGLELVEKEVCSRFFTTMTKHVFQKL